MPVVPSHDVSASHQPPICVESTLRPRHEWRMVHLVWLMGEDSRPGVTASTVPTHHHPVLPAKEVAPLCS
mgnify:CR=1 FL=1